MGGERTDISKFTFVCVAARAGRRRSEVIELPKSVRSPGNVAFPFLAKFPNKKVQVYILKVVFQDMI